MCTRRMPARFARRGIGGSMVLALAVMGVVLTTLPAFATSMLPQNVVDLVSLSERIFVGQVVALRDGFDAQGVPYTEVTVRVDDSIRGDNGGTYTFRQFGLLEPRDAGNGVTNVSVSPDGWPRFRADERVMLFLYQEAPLTGLRTTVGLMQGKFTIEGDTIVNAVGNANVFYGVDVDTAMLSAQEARLVREPQTMDASTFIGFVKRAVEERWVERGRMIHAQH